MMTNRKASEKGALAYWLYLGIKDPINYMGGPVENLVRKSTPDYEGYLRGAGQFWCEFKSGARPKKKETPVKFKFQEGQTSWLARRWHMGGSAWLLCQVGSGARAARYLFQGSDASKVEKGLSEEDLLGLAILSPYISALEMVRYMAFRGKLV